MRYSYAGGAADFVFDVAPSGFLRLRPASLLVWADEAGGTRVTDLEIDGVAVSAIPVGDTGQVPAFEGPDDFEGDLWAATAPDKPRIRLMSNAGEAATDASVAASMVDPESETYAALSATLAPLTAQAFGFENHGNVSGAVTFEGPTASHRFSATGPTTITLDGYDEGMVATLICFAGADDVTVVDAGEVTLVDGTAWSAELARGVWISGGGGGTPAEPDTTPPTNVTGLVATGGEGQVALSWTAATDAESTVSYRYRVYLTSGGPTGTYATTTSTSATVTGLAAGTYSAQVYAYSAGGASTIATTSSFTVTAPLTTFFLDTFTRADGQMIPDRTTPDLGTAWTADGAYSSFQIVGGKLTTNGQYARSTTTSVGREIAASVSFPDGSTGFVNFGCFSPDNIQATLKGNGQVEFSGASGSAIFNAAGGTNTYTPAGYITGTDHTFRLTTEAGIATIYVDSVMILQAAYVPDPPTTLQVFLRAGTGAWVDNLEAKA